MLYAGTTLVKGFKYSLTPSATSDIVKKLKFWSKSAGNFLIIPFNKNETSETLRNKTVVDVDEYFAIPTHPTPLSSALRAEGGIADSGEAPGGEKVKPISVHVPNHLKPVNDDQFGHYLAGLIDGDGHFSKQQQLVIVFNSLDTFLAYYIKKQIGFGSVKKVKDKNAVLLVISSKKGLEKVINLINEKIRTEDKFNQIMNNILNQENYTEFKKETSLKLNLSNDFKNHWLAGFSDAVASFQIKVLNRNNRVEVRLNYQVDQKKDTILRLIKNFLGGNIGYIKTQDTWYYASTSFGSAKNVINYFDYFHLLSSKHINFLKWRKAYLIIQNKNHLSRPLPFFDSKKG